VSAPSVRLSDQRPQPHQPHGYLDGLVPAPSLTPAPNVRSYPGSTTSLHNIITANTRLPQSHRRQMIILDRATLLRLLTANRRHALIIHTSVYGTGAAAFKPTSSPTSGSSTIPATKTTSTSLGNVWFLHSQTPTDGYFHQQTSPWPGRPTIPPRPVELQRNIHYFGGHVQICQHSSSSNSDPTQVQKKEKRKKKIRPTRCVSLPGLYHDCFGTLCDVPLRPRSARYLTDAGIAQPRVQQGRSIPHAAGFPANIVSDLKLTSTLTSTQARPQCVFRPRSVSTLS